MPRASVFTTTIHKVDPNVLFSKFEIVQVRPVPPVENTEIQIDFLLKRTTDTHGWVEYTGVASPGHPKTREVTGAANQELRGTVVGLAPTAGKGVWVELEFHQRHPAEEFPPVERTAAAQINVAASYVIGLESFEVGNTRNGPDSAAVPATDFVVGACSAKWGTAMLARPATSKETPEEQVTAEPFKQVFGRHRGGDVVPTSFQFGPFTGVPTETPQAEISYVFNHSDYAGGGREQALRVLNWLSGAGKVVGQATEPSYGAAWTGLDSLIVQLNQAMFSSCDGVVAADKIIFPGELLDQLTADVGDYVEIRHDPGRNSPAVCGATSNYYVKVVLQRVSAPGRKVVGGPFGGRGGAPFEERRWPGSVLVGGVIRAGARVDAVQLRYSNQRSVQHGGDGGGAHEFTLNPGERIWGISGRCGARVDAIAFHTNQRVIGPFGGGGGHPFNCGDQSLELIGICGRSGAEIDAIGGVFKPT